MRIGVPKEIKNQEYRVGMTPASVREVLLPGHEVLVETGAGNGIGSNDEAYADSGARIVGTAEEVFQRAEMIVKVKEPQPEECRRLWVGQILFTYLYLAPDPTQTTLLLESGCTAIAYETVTAEDGSLPLLAPMSEVAGRMATQVGAVSLHRPAGGLGRLIGGVPSTKPAKTVIIGGGVVGSNSARVAVGMGAEVVVLDRSVPRLRALENIFDASIQTRYATTDAIEELSKEADLIIGAVLVPKAQAPKLLSRVHLGRMKPGAVLVDVAIDQSGCFETSRPTTHDEPTYMIDGIVHYCVAIMPGAVPQTSTHALNNATLPHMINLANKGWRKACSDDPNLRAGLNIHKGKITCGAVAEAMGKPLVSAQRILAE